MPNASSTMAKVGLGLWAAMLAAAGPATAQVLEIGDDGQVTRYDRPSVFGDAGARPIEPARPQAPAVQTRQAVRQELANAAQTYALSPALVEAVAHQESGLRQEAISPAGATGVMQLMPQTARQLGVDRFDLRQNIHGGVAYMAQMLNRFDGDVVRALAAYNAGPAAVERFGGVPPYAETRRYVADILERLALQAVPKPR